MSAISFIRHVNTILNSNKYENLHEKMKSGCFHIYGVNTVKNILHSRLCPIFFNEYFIYNTSYNMKKCNVDIMVSVNEYNMLYISHLQFLYIYDDSVCYIISKINQLLSQLDYKNIGREKGVLDLTVLNNIKF